MRYGFPSAEQNGFATASFEGVPVGGSIKRPPWSLLDPKPAFHALMQSTTFQRLASLGLENDKALCKKIMDILVKAGADSTAILAGQGRDFDSPGGTLRSQRSRWTISFSNNFSFKSIVDLPRYE
jgi:hypothetical protein